MYFKADEELFAHPGTQTYDAVIESTDGARHDVIFHKATFEGPDGEVAGLIGAVVDITDRKQAEAAIQDQLDELRRWHEATLGREGRVLELKKEVNELLARPASRRAIPSALEGGRRSMTNPAPCRPRPTGCCTTPCCCAVVVVYDLATSRYPMGGRPLRQALVGVSRGLPRGRDHAWHRSRFEPGIVFDTRSVLLAVSGLFLGAVPTVVAVTMTAAFRLLQGGAGGLDRRRGDRGFGRHRHRLAALPAPVPRRHLLARALRPRAGGARRHAGAHAHTACGDCVARPRRHRPCRS